MKTAKLPGFTAETSIYNSTVTYRSLSAGAGIGSTSVVPALVGGGTVGGLGGGGVIGPCFGSRQCSECIPTGPSIITDCSPTIGGGCRCRLVFKGFLACTVPRPQFVAR
jgi:hypothetical protein